MIAMRATLKHLEAHSPNQDWIVTVLWALDLLV